MNVLLYILDSLRPDFLSCYGFGKNTSPNIDALSSDGVLYENVYSTATWTKAAAASIITSQFPRSLRMMHEMDLMPDCHNALPRVLKRYGFQCYAISANAFFSPNFGFSGFDKFFNLQLDKELQKRRIRDPELENQFLVYLKTDKIVLPLSEDINQTFFPLLEGSKETEKKFIMAWSTDTHAPFFVRGDKSFFGNFVDDFIRGREVKNQNIEKVKSLYCDMIRYNDYHLGQLISKLKEKGLYENSLIIITADHGESFGEHRWILKKPTFGHSSVVYEEVIKVPLIIKYPQNKFAGKRYETPVQLVDFYPTILDVCGIKTNEIETEGQSLNPLSFPHNRERIIFAESQIEPFSIHSASVRIGDKKLIKVNSRLYFGKNLKKIARNILEKLQIPSVQFYDLFSDPKEQSNLARKRRKETKYLLEKYYEIVEKCDEKVKLIGKKQEKNIDEEVKKRLEDLGYFND